MKNKNIKNKSQKCGRWLFLHSRFSKISRTPLLKGIYQLNPQNLSSTTTTTKAEKHSPIKTINKTFIFRLYRN